MEIGSLMELADMVGTSTLILWADANPDGHGSLVSFWSEPQVWFRSDGWRGHGGSSREMDNCTRTENLYFRFCPRGRVSFNHNASGEDCHNVLSGFLWAGPLKVRVSVSRWTPQAVLVRLTRLPTWSTSKPRSAWPSAGVVTFSFTFAPQMERAARFFLVERMTLPKMSSRIGLSCLCFTGESHL